MRSTKSRLRASAPDSARCVIGSPAKTKPGAIHARAPTVVATSNAALHGIDRACRPLRWFRAACGRKRWQEAPLLTKQEIQRPRLSLGVGGAMRREIQHVANEYTRER